MASAPAARIFVSYARSDGKEIAAKLRSRLQDEHGFPLWQDLADLEGGKGWWLQITDAIDHVEFLVLVMTSAALRSEHVRREWRYARQQGRCVIPVIGAKGIDFDSLPGWMRRAHFVDPDDLDQWRRFVRTLEAPCEATRAPFMVEDLPQVFVQRPRELESLVASLLDQSGEEPVAITAALKGAGGYGKTTLARAICHEEGVQNAFDDGILWVTLGEQPGDVQSHVVDLIEVLTNERPGFKTTDAAVTRLGEVIGERRMLIVIDDVWQAAHARPFLQAGPSCARLITTRNRDALPPKAKALDVDAMKESEAIKLLRFGLPDGEDATFASLAQRLGEWPLLLKLVNGALHKRHAAGQPLAPALASVNAGLDRRGLTVFDARNPVDRGDAVAKTLGVSLELFTEDERARFAELAIFPEDLDLPLAVVETLWSRTAGFDEFETEALCTRLYDQSLLLGLDLATRRIRLHDVIRGYLQAGQKERLPTLHAELIEAYRVRCGDGWHTGPDDGYFFPYLPWHIREAGRAQELHKLLFDYRWLRRKLEAVGLVGLIQDFEQLGTDEQAQKMAEGLRLSAHALADDSRQLAGQLLGRFAADDGPEIANLLEWARERADRPALLPLRPTLTPPDTALISILAGHTGFVSAVAALPEHGQALSAGSDGSVRLWDLESGQEVRRFEGHSSGVQAVAALPERGQALSGGSDNTVRLWDLKSGQEMRRFEGHSGGVNAVAALPKRGQVLSGGGDDTVRLWDLESSQEVRRFEGHGSPAGAVAVLAECGQALSAGINGTVRLWDLVSGREVQRFESPSGGISAVAALPKRGQLLTAGFDGVLRLWNLKSGQEIRRFDGHNGWVEAVAVLPERGEALSAGQDGTLRLWNLESGQEVRRYEGHGGWVTAVTGLEERSQALSAGIDGTLRLWNLDGGYKVSRFARHRDGVFALAALPERGEVLSVGFDGTVRLWNLRSGEEVRCFAGHDPWVTAVAGVSDPGKALIARSNGTVWLWDLQSGHEVQRFAAHGGQAITALAVLSERGQALSAGLDGTVRLWDLECGQEVGCFEGHNSEVKAVVALPERRQALSAGFDRTVRLWDLDSGKELHRFAGQVGLVWALAALSERGQALSGGENGTALWDLDSGREVQRFQGQSGGVSAVAALPERGQVLSGGSDGTVRLWDLGSGKLLAIFAADASILCCAVTPHASFVLGDSAGQIHVLEILP